MQTLDNILLFLLSHVPMFIGGMFFGSVLIMWARLLGQLSAYKRYGLDIGAPRLERFNLKECILSPYAFRTPDTINLMSPLQLADTLKTGNYFMTISLVLVAGMGLSLHTTALPANLNIYLDAFFGGTALSAAGTYISYGYPIGLDANRITKLMVTQKQFDEGKLSLRECNIQKLKAGLWRGNIAIMEDEGDAIYFYDIDHKSILDATKDIIEGKSMEHAKEPSCIVDVEKDGRMKIREGADAMFLAVA